MANISVGAAIGSGFGLIARRPVSVVVWGLVPMLFQVALLALVAPAYLEMFSQLRSGASPVQAMAAPQMSQISGIVQLLNFAQLAISAVIYCAVFRAVLHPERSSFAYLRVGAEEFFIGVLIFGGSIALFVALLVVMIPIIIVAAIIGVAAHGSAAAIGILFPVVFLVIMIALVIVGLRFVFVGPMIVADGKFRLFESWTMTRGHVGSLFLIGLGLFGVLLVFEVVVIAVVIALGAGAIGMLGGLGAAQTLFEQSPQVALMRILPLLAVYLVIMIPISGCLVAIGGAPWAKAYQDLLPSAADAFA
jgi:hypothetical protein